MKVETGQTIPDRVTKAERLWLFLDYDGTLADFAPSPEHVDPDPELVALIERLVLHPQFRVAVVSGRRLSHVQSLVPVPGILLAGTYGVELQTPEGAQIDRLDYDRIRAPLATLKPQWAGLVAGRDGFFLEDKGWALAIHARFALQADSEQVLADARHLAESVLQASYAALFRILGGHRFLEVGPTLAHKGKTVDFLLRRYAWARALPVYLGDDDKDEEAFGAIRAHGGLSVVVASEPRESRADFRLRSPQAARHWLATLLDSRQ